MVQTGLRKVIANAWVGKAPAVLRRGVERLLFAAALLALVLFFIAYYPGGMITDSINQLEQVRGGWFADWHPPFMALLWRLMELLLKGPLLMFLAQAALFFFAVWRSGLALWRGSRGGAAFALATAVLALPLSGVVGVVWKDAWSTAFLAWAVLFVARSVAGHHRRAGALAAAFGCCVGAMLFRHNAIFAVFPLLCWGVAPVVTARGMARWIAVPALGACVSVAGFAIANAANARLTTTHAYPEQSILLFDLAGIAATADDPGVIDRLSAVAPSLATDGRKIDTARVMQLYRPATWTDLAFDADSPMRTTLDGRVRNALLQTWGEEIKRNPGAYLTHRSRVFGEVLAMNERDLFAPTAFQISEGHAIYDFVRTRYADVLERCSPSPLQAGTRDFILEATRAPLYRPWVWFSALLLLAAILLANRPTRTMAAAVGGSALCSELMLFFIAPSADFRYSHWMIYVVWYFFVAAMAEAWFRKRPEGRENRMTIE